MASTTLQVDVRLSLDRFELVAAFTASQPVTGIFGPSGAGKTSLLEAIAGLRRGARGRIQFGDQVWLDSSAGLSIPPERRQVGYVPQDGLLFPHRSVRQNLMAGVRRAVENGQRPEAVVRSVVELLELEPLLDRSVVNLSGGERQRVALGRALCSGPRLLLLDEPLASLDLPLRRRLLPFLRRVRAEFRTPMLLVTHDPLEVQALCEEVLVLREGRFIARGEPRRVLTDPAVFPLAEEEGFENLLPGRLVRREGATWVVRLAGTANLEIAALAGEGRTGEEVLVGIPAHEILIATRQPEGLSARNVLPGRVLECRPVADRFLVTAILEAEVPPLAIEVAEATPASLGLAAGSSVFLVFKAASCRVYGSPGADGADILPCKSRGPT